MEPRVIFIMVRKYCADKCFSKFIVALICFQSQHFLHFKISNQIIAKDKIEWWREIFVYQNGEWVKKN
jgi:hypothetical protein